jgi:phytoene synthase
MSFEACEQIVREGDPDRFFSALFAPKERRGGLYALYAFNIELARIGETIREPMLGQIRLAWWHETVEQARVGSPRAHPVAEALAAVLKARDLPLALFDDMIDARHRDLGQTRFNDLTELETYCADTGGALAGLAALWLEGEDNDVVQSAGTAFALTGILRNMEFHARANKSYIPEKFAPELVAARARRHYEIARELRPGKAMAALLPTTLVPLYLKNLGRQVSLHRRQWRLLRAAMRGRI